MPKKESTIINALLFALYGTGALLSMVMVSPHEYKKRLLRRFVFGPSYNSYRSAVYNSKKRGLVRIETKGGKKFLKLTKKGELEVLLAKAKLPKKLKWDGRWRMVIFDIPEDAKQYRDRLRSLLKKNNYLKLQASVYINPYPLNREAIRYLKETGLDEYIRIIKVEEIDSDTDLKKKFKLN